MLENLKDSPIFKSGRIFASRDAEGRTLLHRAVNNLDKDLVNECFLNHEHMTPEIFAAKDNLDRTVLHYAKDAGMLDVLLNQHEHMTTKILATKSSAGYTVLQEAVMRSNKDMVKLLLENEHMTPDIFAEKDARGETVLHYAVRLSTKPQSAPVIMQILKLLLEDKHMTPSTFAAKNPFGRTVLHLILANRYIFADKDESNMRVEIRYRPSLETLLHVFHRNNIPSAIAREAGLTAGFLFFSEDRCPVFKLLLKNMPSDVGRDVLAAKDSAGFTVRPNGFLAAKVLGVMCLSSRRSFKICIITGADCGFVESRTA